MNGPVVLLEIGTEELPARFLPAAIADLHGLASAVFDEFRIPHKEIRAMATPRRLCLIIHGVAAHQSDVAKEIFGPSRVIAFDEQGNPTQAALGFARSHGIAAEDLVTRRKGKGEHVVAVIEEKGRETISVLPEMLRKIIFSLRFPKSMRWGSGSLTFARPIHWILALFDFEVIAFDIDGIRSSAMTKGHRFLSPASFQIREINSYVSMLENNFVVLDQNKRKNLIKTGMQGLFPDADNSPVLDESLLDTVTYLVEYPVPVLCSFSHEYLSLPKELLTTVMKDHQKYFAVEDPSGKLVNKFVVVSNTKAENAETVRIGAERVIKARFDDAKFYFREDSARPLAERIQLLKDVTFHDALGSLFDKTQRISAIARFLAGLLATEKKDRVLRAAELSKTDLTTGVVREFPELQGTMGKYYALLDGEDADVADALQEHYLPAHLGGALPASEAGAIVSLADKSDTIASFFSIGLVPSGSEDPFALRRQAMGIVSILLDKGYPVSLQVLFSEAQKIVPAGKVDGNAARAIQSFMEQRIEYILVSSGYAQDLVRSVLHLALSQPLKSIPLRIGALEQFREDSVFPAFLLAIKRVFNILPKTVVPALREDLLVQNEERQLHELFSAVRKKCDSLVREDRYADALKVLSELTPAINAFFDKVLVMDKQEEIRQNRFSLLREVWSVASSLADFSRLL